MHIVKIEKKSNKWHIALRMQNSRCGLVVVAATPPSAILKSTATASTTVVTSVVTSASHPSTASAATSEGGPTTIPAPSCTVLPGGCRARFRHPVGPWHFMPRSLTGGLEDASRSLLAASFAAQPVCVCDDHLHNSWVPDGSRVHWGPPATACCHPRPSLAHRGRGSWLQNRADHW